MNTPPRARNGSKPSAVVEHATNSVMNDEYENTCRDIDSSTNTVAIVNLKHPPHKYHQSTTPIGIMADIPLCHSSHTRTLLPGLRRKCSIRRPTQRSRWYTIQEQIRHHQFFPFSLLLTSSISTGNSISGNPPPNMKGAATTTSSPQRTTVTIKPPKRTQRILKYDPITGNEYNKSAGNGRHRNFIKITVLGMIPRNKVLLSIWKLTLLVSFLYININLFQLQKEHHQISQILSTITNTDHFQQRPLQHQHAYHHRALRGSKTSSDGVHDSEYYTDKKQGSVAAPVPNQIQQPSLYRPHFISDSVTNTSSGTNHPSNFDNKNRDAVLVEKSSPNSHVASSALSSSITTTLMASSYDSHSIDNIKAASMDTPQPLQQQQVQKKGVVVFENEDSSNISNYGRDDQSDSNEEDEVLIETISMATAMQ